MFARACRAPSSPPPRDPSVNKAIIQLARGKHITSCDSYSIHRVLNHSVLYGRLRAFLFPPSMTHLSYLTSAVLVFINVVFQVK